MSAILLGEGDVYVTGGGARFHEGADCPVMRMGQISNMCRCGHPLCDCSLAAYYGEYPQPARTLSIGDAVMKGLKPCGTCYPGFEELAARLPADESFGHVKIWLAGDWFCRTCRTRWVDGDGEVGEYPAVWPCATARVLSLP